MQNKILHKSSVRAMLASVVIGISGCGGTCSTSTAQEVVKSAITIDNAGIIPVFGNSSTSTVVYIHNNSEVNITGITYKFISDSAAVKTNKNSKLLSLLNKNNVPTGINTDQCTNIPAGQSCPLQITTPILSGTNTQGSMSIQASYEVNNKPYTFNQIINYAQVQNNQQTAGAKFQTGVTISGYGHPTGYATIYLYGSGQDQIYNVSSITVDKPAVKIVNGNISGYQIQSNFVQAIEISAPTSLSSISATITANSEIATSGSKQNNKSLNLNGPSQFVNSANITVYPNSSDAILATSLVPLINTLNGTTGTMLVQNIGDSDATIGDISAGSGITNLSGCSGIKLASGSNCTVNFTVNGTDGSSNITVPYTGGSGSSISGNVTWFNGDGAALVSMFTSSDPLSFISKTSGQATITVTNVGGYTLDNISVPDPTILSGSATATISNDNCSNQSLVSGASCSYNVNVSDQEVDLNKQINLGFNANYTTSVGVQNYTQSMILNYNSTFYGAILAISPSNPSLTIIGNTLESNTQLLTLSNNGNLTANISTVFTSNQIFLTESATTCGATLEAGKSCTSTIQFGPTFSRSESSGIATYVVNYTSSGQVPSGNVTSNISWTVLGYDQGISLFQQSATGSLSGNGESSGTPYIFNITKQDVGGQSITLSYKNTGTHSMIIKGIQDTNFNLVWALDNSKTTCDSESSVLAPNQTCDIVYENVIESNIISAVNSIGNLFTTNLILPRLIYQDADNGVQFNWRPNLSNGEVALYIQLTGATVSNSIAINESGTNTETVTVSHLLANIDGIQSVIVTSQMEDYFDSPAKDNSVGCSSNSANGIMTQTCIMDKDNLSTSTTYQVNQAYLTESQNLNLNILFSLSPLSQIAAMTSLSGSLNLGTLSPTYAYITSGNNIAMFKQNSSNGMLSPLTPATVSTVLTSLNIAIDTAGKHAYVTREYTPMKNVLMYNISDSGALLPMSPESVGSSVSNQTFGIAYDPTGYLYTLSSNDISMYSQDVSELLSLLSPPTLRPGYGCLGLTISALTQSLYSTCKGGTLNSYRIESTGQLTSVTSFASLENTPQNITVTPNGKYVYMTTMESIVMYSSVNSVLTPLSPESIVPLNSGTNDGDHYIAVHPSGKFAYVVDETLNTVSMFTVDSSTGVLTAISPATVSTGNYPKSITFDPSGKYAYVTNYSSNTVSIYRVNLATGVLSFINNISVSSPSMIAFY